MKRILALFLLAVPLGAMAQTQDVSAQLAAEQSNEANLQQQLNQLGMQFNQIKQEHDSLQQKYSADANAYNSNCAGRPINWENCPSWRAQMLGEQQQLGAQVASQEQQSRDIGAQAADLNTKLAASIQRIGDLQRQQTAFVQLTHAAVSSEDANKILTADPRAIEAAKARSNCQFDTAACGSTKAPVHVETPPAIPAAVLNDPQYKELHGRLAEEKRSESHMRAEVARLKAKQDKEPDQSTRQQLQIDLYHAENNLKTEQGRIRVTSIKMDDRMKVVMGAPILKGGPGAGGGAAKP